ncbi:MAG: hypothetical protein PVG65_04180 [Candidatus Thorarchaeota archaeon]|jgi:hypothetical protein
MSKSGYVLAGFETLATILNNFSLGKRGRFNDNFTKDQISKFLRETCSGFLHSYGQNFSGKKKYQKYNQMEAELYRKCRRWGFFDDCTFIADSGGFQISVGRMDKNESDLLQKMYYDWLREYHQVLQKAFILDVPPGPGCKVFETFEDVYNLNLESYQMARNLPNEVREKIIYIHHFRTPRLWDIYTRILREDDMFSSFKYHGTGGIVANMSADMSIPCIIYVIPMVPLLIEAKKHGRDFLNFHILGGASFRDVMVYELFKKVVLEHHNIKLNITYDSSGLFKSFMIGRYLWVDHPDGYLKKMDLRTPNIDKRFYRKSPVSERYQLIMDEFADKYNFKRIEVGNVYNPETGTFFEDIKVYSMLYMLDQWAVIQQKMKELADKLYPLYEAGEDELFSTQCAVTLKNLNSGKVTKKQIAKSHSILRSLDLLARLDEEYCKYLVTTYLSKDEFKLNRKRGVLTLPNVAI